MSFNAEKFNRKAFAHKLPDTAEFRSLSELELDKVYPIYGAYINRKSMYGDKPVLLMDENYLDLPQHLLKTVETMLEDDDFYQACDNGEIGISVYEYKESHHNIVCRSIKWHNL